MILTQCSTCILLELWAVLSGNVQGHELDFNWTSLVCSRQNINQNYEIEMSAVFDKDNQ